MKYTFVAPVHGHFNPLVIHLQSESGWRCHSFSASFWERSCAHTLTHIEAVGIVYLELSFYIIHALQSCQFRILGLIMFVSLLFVLKSIWASFSF